ncbi:uncharacterized protein DNG_01816 [Cephalotrichum gorgonifer]|uniref:Flavin reductase like domain-containing protein n=1 Tax=Cephalotrichum gorgonifer TaxID=2041049 RepID=A0AAE8MSG9_9PEZI|nr:uncharacterized protein DNG_01816 [Cephalotrichum gorgonifer]
MRGLTTLGLAVRAGPTKRSLGSIERDYSLLRLHGGHTPRHITTAVPQPSPDPTIPLSESFRSLMRLLPHPVVVCTALHPGPTPQPRAMTMSSVTSLSLDPTPLLSFNIKKPSRTLDALRAAGRFNVHVLADDAGGARVAEWFSRGDAGRDPFVGIDGCGCVATIGGEGVELRGRGVRRVLRCKVEELVGVRDHVIVVGEVEGILGGGVEGEAEAEAEGLGLAYADRGYRKIGDVIRKHLEEK